MPKPNKTQLNLHEAIINKQVKSLKLDGKTISFTYKNTKYTGTQHNGEWDKHSLKKVSILSKIKG